MADLSSSREKQVFQRASGSEQEVETASTSSSPPTYQYQSLKTNDEMRILHLKSGTGDSPLQCSIEHVHLHDNPKYAAISYVWGVDQMPYKMHVGENQVIPLTKSLHVLLKDLRASQNISTMTFWVDQICIDQENDLEKNHQVGLMSEIYKSATEVITFIGPKHPGDDEGLDLAVELFNLSGSSWESAQNTSEEEAKALSLKFPAKRDPWESLMTLMDREWTERLWIVQESIVNKRTRMACGSRLIPWEAFAVCVEICIRTSVGHLTRPGDDIRSAAAQILLQRMTNVHELARLKAEYSQERQSLLKILIKEHNLLCTEPKDKIYALPGIAGDRERLGIQVNYALNHAEVFRDAAERILRSGDSLDILHYKGASIPGLPSWATNWAPDDRRMFWGDLDYNYNASAGTPVIVNFEEEGYVLVVHGIFIDEIAFDAGVLDSPAQPMISARKSPEPFRRFKSGLAALCEELGTDFLECLRMFALTLIEGVWWGNSLTKFSLEIDFLIWLSTAQMRFEEGRESSPSQSLDKTAIRQAFLTLALDQLEQGNVDLPTITDVYMEFLVNMAHSTGKHICSTKGKELCTSRSPTKPGDKIVVLLVGRGAIFFVRLIKSIMSSLAMPTCVDT